MTQLQGMALGPHFTSGSRLNSVMYAQFPHACLKSQVCPANEAVAEACQRSS